jgi:hypothetical protein
MTELETGRSVDQNDAFSEYDFIPECSGVVTAAMVLLWKIAASGIADTVEKRIVVGKLFQMFEDLPSSREGECISVILSGPTETFGSDEIYHYWHIILTEDGQLSINAGGYFFRPPTGGDSFTTLIWECAPGYEPSESDLSSAHPVVVNADTFENEVERMDLRVKGFALEATSSSIDEWLMCIPCDLEEI